MTVKLNFEIGKWSPTLKINALASPQQLFSTTSVAVPQHLTCCGRSLSSHNVQFHLSQCSVMPNKIGISQSDGWMLNFFFKENQLISSYFRAKVKLVFADWLEHAISFLPKPM